MKLIRVLKEYIVECIIALAFIVMLILIAIVTRGFQGFWTSLNNASTIIGIITAVFAFMAWAIAHKARRERKNVKADVSSKSSLEAVIIISSSGTSKIGQVWNYLNQEDNKDKQLSLAHKDIIQGDFFTGIDISKLTTQSKPIIPDLFYDEYENNADITKAINIWVHYIKNEKGEKKGRIIEIHFESMPADNEKAMNDFLLRYDNSWDEIQQILSYSGISSLHLFTNGPVVIPYLVQNKFSNTYTVNIYHYTDRYLYAGQIKKKQYYRFEADESK